MNIKQKEIVLIPFPFTDNSGFKVRPGIVISNNKFNSISSDCIIAPLTTVMRKNEFSFILENNDLEVGKLIKKSKIRVDKITPVQKNLVKMKIGSVNNNILNKIKGKYIENID